MDDVAEEMANIATVARLYESQCASEPIHQLGGVQPNGFLIVVELQSGLIVQVSAGVTRHWPGIADASTLLGTALQAWVDPVQWPLLPGLQDLPRHAPVLVVLPLRDLAAPADGRPTACLSGFECVGHATGPYAVLEWIATGLPLHSELQATTEVRRLGVMLTRLRSARNLEDYFADCVIQLQAVSGYDRVMLYRFLPDWSGDIVAEHTAPGFAIKYRGLRFPATDIPPQARALYERNTLRMLNDTEAMPDALLPALLPDGLPLDQSHSLLRSLSAVHQTYLRHMGVRATLVISLLVDGKLWGLLTCHHHQPWAPPHDTRNFMRSSCELIANVVGTRIDDLSRLERRRHAALHASALAELAAAIDSGGDLTAALSSQSDSLCKAFGAVMWGVRVGSVACVWRAAGGADGVAPATAMLDAVERLGQGQPGQPGQPGGAIQQLLQLGKAEPPGLPGAADAAGILLARLPGGLDGGDGRDGRNREHGLCFFMRPELVTEVDWAGDPDAVTLVSTAGEPRLEPRHSFDAWRQSRTGCARPWEDSDLEAAAALVALLGAAHRHQVNLALLRELDWRVHHDELTGLFNRSVIDRELAARLAGGHSRVALFLIDVDHFKRINDSLGHEVGDRVLQEAARRFASATRGADVMVRMGGDEFLLIAEVHLSDPATLDAVAQRLHSAFATDFTGEGWRQRVRISVGVACSPEHGSDAVTLIRHADMALYEAKGQGRSRSAIFDSAVESRIQHATEMESEIERALLGGEFRLFYQPKVDLRTQRVVGLEALVRWQHPQRGLLAPGEFIALAEANGQIQGIGSWVIGEAAAQLARWREAGDRVWPVAVNVSFVQIANGSLLSDVRAACARWGIPFDWLELELTETVVMESTEQSVEVLRALVGQGVKVSLDDFGTGYSSLAHLRQLPLACLKIDRSFVGGLESDAHAIVVTRGIIGMANGLNLITVAEGVETVAQLRWLVEHGCDVGQGYLFSRPAPAAQMAQAVAAVEAADWT